MIAISIRVEYVRPSTAWSDDPKKIVGPITANWHHSQMLQCEASLAESNTHAKGKNEFI